MELTSLKIISGFQDLATLLVPLKPPLSWENLSTELADTLARKVIVVLQLVLKELVTFSQVLATS